jgi:hypothetical protein
MNGPVRFLLVIFLAPMAAVSGVPAVPEPTVDLFNRMLSDRMDAVAHADARRYAKYVADDAVFVDDYGVQETAAAHIATIGRRPVGRSRYVLDSVQVDRRKDDFVIVTWTGAEYVMFGTQEVRTAYRGVETWVARAGRWLTESHSEAQVIVAPPPLQVPPETLQDYVGRYEWWPGYIDTITRDGDQLFSQGTGDTERTLSVAATPESFYFPGEPNLVVFARDRTGRVTHYVLHWSDGHTTVARRIS